MNALIIVGIFLKSLIHWVGRSFGKMPTHILLPPARGRMTRMVKIFMVKKFITDDSGATLIEYALLAGFISIAVVAAVTALGSDLSFVYETVADAIK